MEHSLERSHAATEALDNAADSRARSSQYLVLCSRHFSDVDVNEITKRISETCARPRYARHHSANRRLGNHCDLLVRQLLQLTQHNYFAQVSGQLPHRIHD